MKKIYIVDGNSLLFRAYYATSFSGQIMRTKAGLPTNAIYAFSNMMSTIIHELESGDSLFVSFDTGKKTFRHEQLETYKAQRKPIDEDLKIQLPLARDLLDAMNVYHYELEGHEGDDIAGSIAKLASKNNYKVIIYTSDKDFLQLIDDNIDVRMIRKGLKEVELITINNIKEKFGLTPNQIKDYKGLMGDSSDNLKGIPGIGEKTALKLISEYGSLENIIEAMKSNDSKMAKNIIEHQEEGKLCKMLAAIETDLELSISLDDLIYPGYNFNALSTFFTKYEFYSLLKRLKPCHISLVTSKTKDEENKEEGLNYCEHYINSFAEVPYNIKTMIVDHTPGNYHQVSIQGFIFATNDNVYYLSYDKAINDNAFKDYLRDESKPKYVYNSKKVKVLLSHHNLEIRGITFDLLLASYLLDSSLDNDEVTVYAFFGYNILSSQEISLFEDQSKFFMMAIALNRLQARVIKMIESINCLDLYYNIELPLAMVLADMELEGVPLNRKVLSSINQEYQIKLDTLTKEIYEMAGYEFNIASPKQIANLLFDRLGLQSNKKQSTSIEVLNSLRKYHPIIDKIIEHRKYAKIISTYTTGLGDYIYPDGKIHAMFNQALTTTGRLSSSEPNLQNISVRSEEGKAVRKAFFYEHDDLELLSLDYSQIELRILASLSGEKDLIDVFNHDGDIHSETAEAVFNVSKEELTSDLRRRAKTVNFGIVYGISSWGLAEQLQISAKEANSIIERFYIRFPHIKSYFDKVVEDAQKNLFVTTITNRRRYIRELESDNYQTREFGKRAAMNAPIQGSAADLIKIAMIKISQALKEKKFKSCLILQIHDELIFKVYQDEKNALLNLVKEEMEHAIPLDVKLSVDGGFGKTWYDCK